MRTKRNDQGRRHLSKVWENDMNEDRYTVIMKAASPIEVGEMVHLDDVTGQVYVKGKCGCDICKRNFKNPQGVRIHNGMMHK